MVAPLPDPAGATLNSFFERLHDLPDRRRVACLNTLPQETRRLLYEVTGARSDQAALDENLASRLVAAVSVAEDWAQPSRWRRITIQDAATSVDTLEEMQLVLDSILSNEWEHWGNPRFYRGERRKPDEEFPAGSIGTRVAQALLQGYAGDDMRIS